MSTTTARRTARRCPAVRAARGRSTVRLPDGRSGQVVYASPSPPFMCSVRTFGGDLVLVEWERVEVQR